MDEEQQGLEAQFRNWCLKTIERTPGLANSHAAMFLDNSGNPVLIISGSLNRLRKETNIRIREIYGHQNGGVKYLHGVLTTSGINRIYTEHPKRDTSCHL
jgi:hypothetical protein